MRPSKRDIIIATRKSRLAMAQSESVGKIINRLNPRVALRLVPIESDGDRILDHPLARFGGKGLFTRNVEMALLDGKEADIAVHSLKDLPTDETPALRIVAIPSRAPVHDVLISREAQRIEDLPQGATVGTCSPRRRAQVLRLRPDLNIVNLRGNVETRLRKVLEEKTVDATLLAAAGLMRLGLVEHTRKPIPLDEVLPACGQGALAIQCRLDDHITMRRCAPLNDVATSEAVSCERHLAAALGADCHSPLAVLAENATAGNHQVRLRARVLSLDGKTCLEIDMTGPVGRSKVICAEAAAELIRQGARELLAAAAKEAAAGED
ncbi:MAG: hydroxymethylbilane synthase [Planctomycetes bacterium]|nr:hydroxymethylbilane synthase [Planctomycetota bacterium]